METKEIKTVSLSQQNIKNLFDEVQEIIARGEKPNLYQLQKKYGYTEKSAKAYKVLQTKTWNKLLNEIDDERVITRFVNITEQGKDSDAIKAGIELLKLKGRYPKQTASDRFKKDIKDLLE